jgi:multiple sugar transport system substrate-binding protein
LKLIEAYQNANSEVKIDGESSGWNDYWPRLATKVAGGSAPDLIQMDYRYIFEYARRGALLPLDQFIPNVLKIEDFGQENLESGRVDGKLYGVTLGATSGTTFVKAPAWEEAGVPAPARNVTWEQFADLCTELSKATKRKNFHGVGDMSGYLLALECWLRQRGKALYTQEGQLAFAADDMAAWFNYWDKMRKSRGCVTPELQALRKSDIDSDMLTLGYAASTFGGSNQLVAYQALNKERISMAPYPVQTGSSKPGQFLKPSMFMSISATTKFPEQCARFTNFAVAESEGVKTLGVERGVPGSAAMRAQLAPTLNELDKRMVDYVDSLNDLLGPLPPAPPAGAGELETTLLRVSEEVAFGQASIKAGAEKFTTLSTAILKRG